MKATHILCTTPMIGLLLVLCEPCEIIGQTPSQGATLLSGVSLTAAITCAADAAPTRIG